MGLNVFQSTRLRVKLALGICFVIAFTAFKLSGGSFRSGISEWRQPGQALSTSFWASGDAAAVSSSGQRSEAEDGTMNFANVGLNPGGQRTIFAMVTATRMVLNNTGTAATTSEARASQERYAERHGYTFDDANPENLHWREFFQEHEEPRRGAMIQYAFDLKREVDWILWLDADFVISEGAPEMQEHLKRLRPVQELPVGSDSSNARNASNISSHEVGQISIDEVNLIVTPNNGSTVFSTRSLLFRRCEWTAILLEAWQDAYQIAALQGQDNIEARLLTNLVMHHETIKQRTAVAMGQDV